jgi:hypothetical protein
VNRSTLALTVVGLCLVSACSDDDDYDDIPEDQVYYPEDAADLPADEAAIADAYVTMDYAMVDPLYDDFYYDDLYFYELNAVSGSGMSPEVLAQRAAEGAPSYFVPTSCATGASDGSTATLTLNDCDSVLGGRDITGIVTATFTAKGGGYAVHISTDDLQVGAGKLSIESDATGKRSGSERSLTATSSISWTGPRGRTIERDGETTIAWTQGSGCITAQAEGTSEFAGFRYQATLSGYQRCSSECPTAGTFTWHGPMNVEITLTFDGTPSPELKLPGGVTREIQLSCGE